MSEVQQRPDWRAEQWPEKRGSELDDWYRDLARVYRELAALPRDGSGAGVSLGPCTWECTEDFVDWCMEYARIIFRSDWYEPGETPRPVEFILTWPPHEYGAIGVLEHPGYTVRVEEYCSPMGVLMHDLGGARERELCTTTSLALIAGLLVPAALLRASMTVPETVPQLEEE